MNNSRHLDRRDTRRVPALSRVFPLGRDDLYWHARGFTESARRRFQFRAGGDYHSSAIAREVWRLHQAQHAGIVAANLVPGLVGAAFAFLAGLLALKWLSRWLETGRWYLFGIYCLVAAIAVAFLFHAGY